MCDRTGWSWDYVWNTLEWPRYEAMGKQWAQEPPVNLLVAAYLGFKPSKPPVKTVDGKRPPMEASKFDELRKMFPTGEIKLSG